MGTVHRALKDVTLEKGRRNEEKFFVAMRVPNSRSLVELPDWILEVTRPSAKEDRNEGIDAIIGTKDTGKLFVQIKSSEAGVAHFKAGRHFKKNNLIVILVIRESDTLDQVRKNARKLLAECRQTILASRITSEW
ncbi:hypothetical protein AUJ77_01505 [Candidatus Nomurabacteria bacterium CG1_02_43_90]|uniref:Restriction endonuclease type IV Mrr domain-containing protein n=1 Tax=Candidatus Nomurabacteria bacterium CG1_02_43_90 TaxID=1805281 RepID=A0A1J4V6H4_9BACT|nr:MAG: hypothetical protein AUJ77_01505 [Candidatus Nomurabacteria bacterium CG1_02_43_90]